MLLVMEGGGGAKHVHAKWVVEFRDGSPPGWPLLWAQVEECAIDAQCQLGGFDEFLIAMNWLVLQLGGRSTYTQNGWANFAVADLLADPCWPLLWARVTASAVMAVFIAHWFSGSADQSQPELARRQPGVTPCPKPAPEWFCGLPGSPGA
jgi:hypothetical protein